MLKILKNNIVAKISNLISKDLEHFLQSTQKLVFGNVLTTASSFVISVLISRSLGPEGRGVIAWITSLIILTSIFSQLGMPAINKRFVAEDNSRAGDLALFTILIILLASIIALPFFYYYSSAQEIGRLHKSVIIIGLLIIPTMSVADSLVEIVIGLGKINNYNLIFILSKLFNVILVILLVLLSMINPSSAMIAVLCASLFQILMTIFSLKKYIKLHLNISKIKWVLTHLKYHIFGNYTAQVLSTIASAIPIIVLTSTNTARNVGIFAVATTLINVAGGFFGNMGKSFLVSLPRIEDKKRREKLKINFIITSLILVLPCAVIIYGTAFLSIPIIFGQEFIEAIIILKILSIGLIFSVSYANMQSIIVSESPGNLVMISPFAILIATVIASLTLIPHYGTVGAALSLCTTSFVGLISAMLILFVTKK
jgi:O-antigen/teichoic acid export membrane protein